ncbi:MAG: xanthine dehydrogenase family protein molybdopterin-binding subunit [Rhodoferax sp.]|uniref:xanthine dehydrogenase family protein molybdopterin-binding subunit n=1 Tax=Rhodoferax sp. TaxID=50421 RepID=UPI00260C47CD|nr:xanthine dehydrogenase family protein molybdopterin-binding subunit [Rhodoferax sp.]MDD5332542.1 xanthine dehydrogenase family protein molybdopterin-binding subunit [Rhodoferax sp.]
MTDRQPLAAGKAEIRGDARAKASGTERFAADCYPDQLIWAGAVRAGVASGRLRAVEAGAALAVPGVLRVLTSVDVPGPNRHGIIHKDTPVLVDDRVRYPGDAVALVLAETREALKRGIALVQVEIEPLPGVFDPQAALAPGAAQLHETHPGNILMAAEIRKGDASSVLSACDVVVQGSFSTPVQAHGFLETENGVARLEEDGSIAMTVSTQSPFRDRFEIGAALGLAFDRIRIVSPSLGGGFGGKDGATVQCLLALAALHANGRPVKMQWEREENMTAGYKRHACTLRYRLGAGRDGVLQALSCQLVYDSGAYAHLGGEVMELGMEHAGGPYRIPHVLIEGHCVFTNNPVAGAMRAFGVCQVTFAFESMMDLLAEKLGMDPLELRLRNALLDGDTNGVGMRLITSTGIVGCLKILQDHPLWLERKHWQQLAPPHTRRGVGLASVFNAAGYGGKVRDSAIAKVELTPRGEIVVHNAVTDMGQGNSSAFLQIAGHILGQDADQMKLRQPDTATAYPSGSSSAGRTTYTFGNALIKACEELQARLINRAGLLLFTDSDRDLRLVPGKVIHLPSARAVPLQQLASFMPAEDRVCISQFVAPVCEQIPDTAKGFFVGFPHVIFAYGAHLARIEVDLLSGVIRVCDYLAATDGGAVINPCMFDQQIQGGVAQGLGYALMEDVVIREGVVQNDDLTSYLIPGPLDLPDTLSVACKGHEDSGPFGMKGIGEVAMNGPLPALANALADACGVRLWHAPLTPERVLMAMEAEQWK